MCEKLDCREIFISLLMQEGVSRKVAEESVDKVDDDGTVIGIISKEELYEELAWVKFFQNPEVRREFEPAIAPFIETLAQDRASSDKK